MSNVQADVQYSLHQLRKSPGFAITAVLMLALGIGVNTAMFSVIDQVLLRNLPYQNPNRLVQVGPLDQSGGYAPVSTPDARDWRARSHSFESMAHWTIQVPTLGGSDNPRLVAQIVSTANLFDLLGARPMMGRTFLPEDEKAGRTNVLVLSYRVWDSIFHSDPHILGQSVPVNGVHYTVIGVMPRSFEFPMNTGDEMFSPLDSSSRAFEDRGNAALGVIGRLRPGVSVEQAQGELEGIHKQLMKEYPANESTQPMRVMLYQDVLTGNVRPALYVLDGAVIAVWLIACANVAGLMLVRTNNRRKEIAVRAALGAGRSRLMQQFLTESLVLSAMGGVLGLGIAWGSLRALSHYLPAVLQYEGTIHIDAAACGYLVLASCLSALLFGILPAWSAAHVPAQEGLREGTAAGGTTKRQAFWRDSLVVGEIGMTLVLLIAGGLMIRTLWQLRHTYLGFSPEHVVTTSIFLPNWGNWWDTGNTKGPDLVTTLYDPLIEKLSHTPGIDSVGLSTIRPFSGTHFSLGVWPADEPEPDAKHRLDAQPRASTAGYFSAMGIRLLRGRYFSSADRPGSPLMVVINEAFVRQIFGGRDVLGKQIKWDDDDKKVSATIVGVIEDLHQNSASVAPLPEIHFNLEQLVPGQNMYEILAQFHMDIAVRSRLAPQAAFDAIKKYLHELAPEMALQDQNTMQQVIDDSMGSQTLTARLLGIFGIAALAIAVAGIYGLLAYSVSQRTRELGIRIALGAQRGDVLWLVMRHAFVLLGAGVSLGIVVTVLTRVMLRSFIYGRFDRYDMLTIITVALILCACGVAASYLPARRAAYVDPMVALRTE